jgi:16S rRNA (adenine1518-N6/adenine1519-N6)-dimethyltransferase
MKGNDIRDHLRELGRKPNRRYGQHFLVDQSVLNSILEASAVSPGDRVLEIGPGLGVLTDELIGHGAEVVAIEKDKTLARDLAERLGERVKIIEGDALQGSWDMGQACPERSLGGPWKLVANIPYSITSQIIKKALWSDAVPSVVVLLVQKEVAEKIVEGSKAKGTILPSFLSVMVGLAANGSKIVRKVPRKCFYPPPDVESAVIKIESMSHEARLAKWGADPSKILALASRAFAAPRKKMTTTLVGNGILKENIAKALIAAGASPDARPEELAVDQWAKFVCGL